MFFFFLQYQWIEGEWCLCSYCGLAVNDSIICKVQAVLWGLFASYGALCVHQIWAWVIKGGHSDGFWKWVLALVNQVANSDSDYPDQWSRAIGNVGLVIWKMATRCQKWSTNVIGPSSAAPDYVATWLISSSDFFCRSWDPKSQTSTRVRMG